MICVTTASALKVHKESEHEGVRNPCDECEYVATQMSSIEDTREAAGKKSRVTKETEHIVVEVEEEEEEVRLKEEDITVKEEVLEEDPLAGY